MKKWWKSKTLWVAGIAFVAILITGLSDGVVTVVEIEAALTPIAMVILRLITKQSLNK